MKWQPWQACSVWACGHCAGRCSWSRATRTMPDGRWWLMRTAASISSPMASNCSAAWPRRYSPNRWTPDPTPRRGPCRRPHQPGDTVGELPVDGASHFRTGPGTGGRRGSPGPGVFWLVGQGGTGIRASPAYGALLASQVTGADMPPTNWRRRGWTRRFSIRGVLAAERTGNPQHPVLVRMGVGRLVGRVQERVARPATEGCLLALN